MVAELQSMVYVYRGEVQHGLHTLDEAIRRSKGQSGSAESVESSLPLRAQTALAEADLVAGNAAAALTRLEPWLDRASPYERMDTTLLPLLAWAYSDSGDETRSTALLAECREQTRAHHYLLVLVEALRIQAVLSLRQARYPEVEAALEEALRLARQIHYPYVEAKALSTNGDLLAACGQQSRAREQYAAALAILRPLGEVLYAKRIERALVEMTHS
jgi:tetratricopeptide (TPR) repeat protein